MGKENPSCDIIAGIVQKVFSEKASAIARTRQKCVRNALKMRQNGSCFIGKRGTFQNASEMRQNCVKNASKMCGTPLGENTFWTIPIIAGREKFSSKNPSVSALGINFLLIFEHF